MNLMVRRSRISAGLNDFSLMILFLKVLNGANGLLPELSEVRFEWFKSIEADWLFIFDKTAVDECSANVCVTTLTSADTGGTPYKSRNEINARNKKTSTCAVDR